MNSLEVLTKQFSFSGITLVATAVIVTAAIIILISVVVSLQRKLKKATTPKFGFAGKPIYPVIATLLLSVSIPLAIYSLSQQTTFEQQAEENIVFDYDYSGVGIDGEKVVTEFKLVPVVDGKEWAGKTFDIFWLFEGEVVERKYEFDKSSENPSGYQISLPKGDYKLTILITYENKTKSVVEDITIE